MFWLSFGNLVKIGITIPLRDDFPGESWHLACITILTKSSGDLR
jgi:hypothetical protein